MLVFQFERTSATSLRVRKILTPSRNELARLTSMPVPKIPLPLAGGGGTGAPGPPGTGGGRAVAVGGIARVVGAGADGVGGFGASWAAFKSSSCFCRFRICV